MRGREPARPCALAIQRPGRAGGSGRRRVAVPRRMAGDGRRDDLGIHGTKNRNIISVKNQQNHLLVVLAMHCGGALAMMRALELLEVRSGEHTRRRVADRPEGFAEDREIIEINEELLALQDSAHDRLGNAFSCPGESAQLSRLKLRASALLQRRLSAGATPCGFGDPRTCRLLAFWLEIFESLDARLSFIIVLRNPASVAATMQQSRGIEAQKSYILWLQHLLPAVLQTRDTQRIVVDCDRFMAAPWEQLARIADALRLPLPSGEPQEVARQIREALRQDLGDATFSTEQLKLDRRATRAVVELHQRLDAVARDQASIDDPALREWLIDLDRQLSEQRPLFEYASALESAGASLRQEIAALEKRRTDARCCFAVGAQEFTARSLSLPEAHDGNPTPGSLVDRLKQELAEKERELAKLRHQASNSESLLVQAQTENAALRSSRSWRLTRPLRAAVGVLRKLKHRPPARISADRGGQELHEHGEQRLASPLAFDPDFYLKAYPDIREAGVDPREHFFSRGIAEGRLGAAPPLDADGDVLSFDPNTETVLVVNHEASRTGAPILGLNIVQRLAERYNVLALLLGGGEIAEAFRGAGAVVVRAPAARGSHVVAEATIHALCEMNRVKFAIVNSIESRWVLPALAQRGVPVVTLVHEFAANTRPRDGFPEAVLWSPEMVFSTEITLENARKELLEARWDKVHVLPQGRCVLPTTGLSDDSLREERKRLVDVMRPLTDAERKFVVLGAGTVDIRKGVDLFLQCAAAVSKLVGANRLRFVWIGKGFDADRDGHYSVYLADQIERAGLSDIVVFADASPAIEAAYAEADALLLSSRLDPLPNVAIDAMAQGIPVLCFESTTGLAAILQEEGLGHRCVAGYLDVEDMARKIAGLCESGTDRDETSARCRSIVATRFDMSRYVAALEDLAAASAVKLRNEMRDRREILDSGKLRMDFAVPPHLAGIAAPEFVHHYVRGWSSGAMRRKPEPGFHPGVYAERKGLLDGNVDPYADFLRRGAPDGPWKMQVIDARRSVEPVGDRGLRVAIHLHVFYREILSEFLERVDRNVARPDLWVSVPSLEMAQELQRTLENYAGRVARVSVVPNRGRDIGPLLTEFGDELIRNYDVIGHFHTKASRLLRDEGFGRRWNRFILENLVGGTGGGMMDVALGSMAADKSIGLVFPDDPYGIGLSRNRQQVCALASRLGLGEVPHQLNFPIGTMFWARAQALEPWLNFEFAWEDYPAEPLGYDGTMLHAIERMLPMVTEMTGLRCVVTNVEGVTR